MSTRQTVVYAQQNDTVDKICQRHYGRTAGTVEQVYRANTGLAALGAILPINTPLAMPLIAENQTSNITQLWD